jgi:hypothetical protein
MDCSSRDPIRARLYYSIKYGTNGVYGFQKRYRVTEFRDLGRGGSSGNIRCGSRHRPLTDTVSKVPAADVIAIGC